MVRVSELLTVPPPSRPRRRHCTKLPPAAAAASPLQKVGLGLWTQPPPSGVQVKYSR